MYHDGINTHQLHHDDVAGKAVFEFFINHGITAVPLIDGLQESLNEGSAFTENGGYLNGGLSVEHICHYFLLLKGNFKAASTASICSLKICWMLHGLIGLGLEAQG